MQPIPALRIRDAAFTLLELLVTITIISILATMGMMAMRLVREAAEKTVCASNVRQLGTAILVYAGDNRNAFPQYNFANCNSWPYIFGDWGTGHWGKYTDFYIDYLPLTRSVYFCPGGRKQHAGTGDEFDAAWKYFPNKPPTYWILDIGYCYFGGSNELKTNRRGGPRTLMEGGANSTLLADTMKFGASPTYAMSPGEWSHRGGVGASGVLNGKAGGNMFYCDGHVRWVSDPAELMRHRQKINGNDNRSYAAEQPNDPP